MGDVRPSLIGSTSVAFAIAVVVVWSFMNMVGSFMRDFVGRLRLGPRVAVSGSTEHHEPAHLQ